VTNSRLVFSSCKLAYTTCIFVVAHKALQNDYGHDMEIVFATIIFLHYLCEQDFFVYPHYIILNRGDNRCWRCDGPHQKKDCLNFLQPQAPTLTLNNLVLITRFIIMM
jgi:hypothetical protein